MTVFLYKGESQEVAYTYTQNHLYKGEGKSVQDILFTFDGRYIFDGAEEEDIEKIQYTFDGKHLYKGKFCNSKAILLTYDSRYIFMGNEVDDNKMILYYDGKKLWAKDENGQNFIVFTAQDYIPECIFLVLKDKGLF